MIYAIRCSFSRMPAAICSGGRWAMSPLAHGFLRARLQVLPADGDLRVRRHFGGKPEAAAPTPRLVDQAPAILPKIGAPLLFARVDGIERDGDFVLMELEVNEPYVFLSLSDDAPARFADAIAQVLS